MPGGGTMITIRGTVRGCNECSVDVQLVVADDMGAGSESDRFWFGLGEDGNDNTVVARAFGALIGIDGGVIIRIDKAADATGLARRGRVLAMSGNDPPPTRLLSALVGGEPTETRFVRALRIELDPEADPAYCAEAMAQLEAALPGVSVSVTLLPAE